MDSDIGPRIAALAPLAIGLALTLIHLIAIPITNTSVNPAGSTGLFAGGWALSQLWRFWVAPVIGGAAGGFTYRVLMEPQAPRVVPVHAVPAE